ncbi:MAG: type IV pilus secretin PilQ, partial [Candidatus Desulfofervidaceae bacterium]|nr:type IV pilus secretin PilQ [Candidatus Desulfofervidaceae bacterium]
NLPKSYALNNPIYPKLRWGMFKNKLRLVIDCALKDILPYHITVKNNVLKITLDLEKKQMPLAKITAIDFEQVSPQKCRLIISADRKLQYEVFYPKLRTLVLQLYNVKIPFFLLRELETKYFSCGIERILPRSLDEKTVDIEINFKRRIPFKVVTTKQHLYLTFNVRETKEKAKVKLAEQKAYKEVPERKEKKVEKAFLEKKEGVKGAPLVSPFIQKATQEEPLIIFPGTVRVFTGRPVVLDFQDADIKNVFRILADMSGLNIIVSEGVKGKVTLKLKNVPWDQALDLLLQTYNLGVVKKGNVLRILPIKELKKQQELLIQAQKALEQKRESEPLITEEIQVNYVKAADLVKQLKDIKTSRGKLTYDEATNRIIMTDVRSALERARRLVRSLDIAPRQVMIEARIVEVNTNFSKELGIQWGGDYLSTVSRSNLIGLRGGAGTGDNFSFTNSLTNSSWSGDLPLVVNLPPGGAYGGLGFTLGHLGRATTLILDAKLQAMESEGKGKIVSVPKVITMDNQEAIISQGLEIPYRTTSEEGTRTEFREATLKLTVKPHITPDRKIRMELNLHKDSAGEIQPGMDAIPIEKKEITTTLLVDNNETVVIGGIISEETRHGYQRVPFFYKIPILGWLFQNKTSSVLKRELLIFITPRVLSSEGL